jgi:hypothetical protein
MVSREPAHDFGNHKTRTMKNKSILASVFRKPKTKKIEKIKERRKKEKKEQKEAKKEKKAETQLVLSAFTPPAVRPLLKPNVVIPDMKGILNEAEIAFKIFQKDIERIRKADEPQKKPSYILFEEKVED